MLGYTPTYEEIENKIGTPAYIFDIDVLKDRIKFIRENLGENIDICYAMKTNPFVVGSIGEDVDRFEVCSHGEFKICERAEVPMDKVVLSGVYKEPVDTKRIVKTYGDKILYTSESVRQFHLVNEAAVENGITVDVILRVTIGNQFGIDEEDLCQLVETREQYKGVNIVGIQHFTGTQRKNLHIYQEELDYCDGLIERLKRDYGYEASELEFGTGFYFEYFQPKKEKDKKYDEKEQLKEFAKIVNNMKFKGKITLEIGRFIAASCGKYYTKIVDSKINNGTQFAIVDGGMHQVNYYGQMMAMKLPYYRQLKKDGGIFTMGGDRANICGSLCTINDILVKAMPLENPDVDDIIELQNTGGYSMTEAPSLFLSRDLPKIYLYSEAKGLTIRRDRFETNILNY